MADIKKGAEAKQAVEGFAKKGKAFICGKARMLEAKVKGIDLDDVQAAIGIGIIIGSLAVGAACSEPYVWDRADSLSALGVAIGGLVTLNGAANAINSGGAFEGQSPSLLKLSVAVVQVAKDEIKDAIKNRALGKKGR